MKDVVEFLKYIANRKSIVEILLLLDDKNLSTRPQNRSNIDVDLRQSTENIKLLFEELQGNFLGLCCYLNGSITSKGISDIRFHFVDIDKIPNDEEVRKFKLQQILDAPLKPTMVYEGRGGFKVLYRVNNAIWENSSEEKYQESLNRYKNIQQQLIEYFDGDEGCVPPSQPMRMPFVNNYKEISENRYYTETIKYINLENQYDQELILKKFPGNKKRFSMSKSKPNSYVCNEEYKGTLELFIHYLEDNGLSYKDYQEKIIFQCPIHEDKSPSSYMFKNNLIVHCSSGNADENNCEIANGKHLRWVAERLGWEDLVKAIDQLKLVNDTVYKSISLTSVENENIISFKDMNLDKSKFETKLINSLYELYKKRKRTLSSQDRELFIDLDSLLSTIPYNCMCIPLPPGTGKSTFLEVWLKTLINFNMFESGTIVVVERIETAKILANSLNSFPFHFSHIDRVSNEIAYVMESPQSYEQCMKEIKNFSYGICRRCEYKQECKLPRKYTIQEEYPIVIITHARFAIDAEKMYKYKKWYDAYGECHERKYLIIDEKPIFTSHYEIKLDHLLNFKQSLDELGISTKRYSKDIKILEQLIDNFESIDIEEILPPLKIDFEFAFKGKWLEEYSGKTPDIIENIEMLIKKGGSFCQDQKNCKKIHIVKVPTYDLSEYSTIILDGTAKYDIEYNLNKEIKIIEMPINRQYHNLTFYRANLSLSKANINKDSSLLVEYVNKIKEVSMRKKTLVLCYKTNEEYFKEELRTELLENRVMINHYGNVKGTNEYAKCNAIFLAGVQHKGDPFYVNQYKTIHNELPNTTTNTVKSVRRFHNIELEILKLNDQLVNLIQDICRISIRNREYKEEVHVYMASKDDVLVSLLKEHFYGSEIKTWEISTYNELPEWYNPVNELFNSMTVGEEVKKRKIAERVINAEKSTSAIKQEMRRMVKNNHFISLLEKHNMEVKNTQVYVKC